jgi:hypothetical protein
MRGIHALKGALNSQIQIVTGDIDWRFELPDGRYDLALLLGVLYHLKNPYYILELLARHVRYCFFSTRVARFTPEGTDVRNTSVAYLLREDELNSDDTNFWIFSETGLKRVLHRSGWEVCDYMTIGETKRSRPDTSDHDERAFCLMRSCHFPVQMLTPQLMKGWHIAEGPWRWTERIFSVELPIPHGLSDSVLEMEFTYPEQLKEHFNKLRINAAIGFSILREAEYSAVGEHYYRAHVPHEVIRGSKIVVEFELSGAIPPDSHDQRERGIIVQPTGFRWV